MDSEDDANASDTLELLRAYLVTQRFLLVDGGLRPGSTGDIFILCLKAAPGLFPPPSLSSDIGDSWVTNISRYCCKIVLQSSTDRFVWLSSLVPR